MITTYPLCEECRRNGQTTLAAYVSREDVPGLDGPAMGDPDYWPEPVEAAAALCVPHFARLPDALRHGYGLLELDEV